MAKTISGIPFLGTGWTFPPEFNKGIRNSIMVSGAQDIKESLHILLSTKPGERLMNPKYGCDLSVMLFEPISRTLLKYVEDLISMAILHYEPRITLEKVIFNEDAIGGILYIDVQYVVRTTNSRSNMVYPFYLNEGTNL